MKTKLFFIAVCFWSLSCAPMIARAQFAPQETPPQVQNVKLLSGNQSLEVSWDKIENTQNLTVAGYKIYYGTRSVQDASKEVYEHEMIVPGNTASSAAIKDLINGVQYFVAVTAVNGEGAESDGFSFEQSQTPRASTEETAQPPASETPVQQAANDASSPVEAETSATPFEPEPAPIEPYGPWFPEQQGPLEVSDFSANTDLLGQGKVTLSWGLPAVPFMDQILYLKKGDADWDNGYSVGRKLDHMEIKVDANAKYQAKLAVVGTEGVESKGSVISFSTYLLPKSGPSLMIGLLAGICLAGAWLAFLFHKKVS